ncbi:MAG: transglycosylase domain-containing protein [Paludibacteraceae bacterium]|nr:transglycosylase domain-containing protein [Paludibacteraceae bacterium]
MSIHKNLLIKIGIGFASIILGLYLFIIAINHNFLGLFGNSPTKEQLENPINMEASEIYSDDGMLIGKYFIENRSSVDLENISQAFIQTLIETEDKRFYEHNGVDFKGLFGAFKDALLGNARGASTITQQLVKNLFKTRTEYSNGLFCKIPGIRTFIIKVKEWKGAMTLEEIYSKEEILEMYVNTVYFGNHSYGIKAAAKSYFNQSADKLNFQQSATLVGILKATTYYNPIRNPENSKKRRNDILVNLHNEGLINEETCDSLCQLPIELQLNNTSDNRGIALYFREAVFNEMQSWCEENGKDLYRDGLKIYTTIDSRMQKYAEEAVKSQMKIVQNNFNLHWGDKNPWRDENQNELKGFIEDRIKKSPEYKLLSERYNGNTDSIMAVLNRPHRTKVIDYQTGMKDTIMSTIDSLKYTLRFLHCGFVVMEPQTGKVKAWVGDVDFNYWQYDKVVAKRQPGSTFKLFIYTEAIRKGLCSCDTRVDSAINWSIKEEDEIKIWMPQNANRTFSDEEITLKSAFARSINSVAVQLTREYSPDSIVQLAQSMGIKSNLRPIPSIGLGAEDVSLLEMVTAYSTIVDEGEKHTPILVTRIEDRNGNILYENHGESEKVLDCETAFIMRDMLQEGLRDEHGTSQRLKKYPIFKNTEYGGKTGTSSNYSDAWYMGISPKLVGGVWVGGEYRSIHFRDGAHGQGSQTALPIFGDFMSRVMRDKNLAHYQGLFGEPKQEISKTYNCEGLEKKNIGEGFVNFWKKLFGRDKKDSINNDTTTNKNKSRREKRRERRERRRNGR